MTVVDVFDALSNAGPYRNFFWHWSECGRKTSRDVRKILPLHCSRSIRTAGRAISGP